MKTTQHPIKCTFHWDILAGKTLEITVGTDIDSHDKTKAICVVGRDKTAGKSYILHTETEKTEESNEALDKLLQPIVWDYSSSIRARQNLVCSRHDKVKLVLPFLTGNDLQRALKWLCENKHSGLWD